MADQIISVAVHHLNKVGQNYQVVAGNSAVSITDTVVWVVDALHKQYTSRASKSYGRFSDDEVNYPTSAHLRSHIQNQSTFEQLTLALMATLAVSAQAKPGSSGGHVVFALFEKDGRTFFIVAIVNNKIGAALTQTGQMTDVTHLDLEGFRFAGRVNITGWAASEPRYIGFLRGKGDVADYFKAFLGCDSSIENRTETKALISALKDFTAAEGYNAEQRNNFLERARLACVRDSKEGEPLDFQKLSNELVPANPQSLVMFLGNPDLALNDGYVADRTALRGLVQLKGKTKHWRLEFDRDALQANKVRYDPETNTIVLQDVPDSLIGEIMSEPGNDD